MVDGPGGWLGFWTQIDPATQQPVTDHFGVLYPTGLGLSLEIGPVTLGGFLDYTGGPTERYAGLIYGKIRRIEVKAFGIHELIEGSFPPLKRLAIAYDNGQEQPKPSIRVKIALSFYYALTSNTLQLGAKAELTAQEGKVTAHGFIGFDALIQLKPFFFSIHFSAGFTVRYRSRTLAGIKVSGTLSGPGPLTVAAEFCIEILFSDLCWSGSFDIGRAVTQTLTTVSSLLLAVAEELAKTANLAMEGGRDLLAAAGEVLTEGAVLMLSPLGRLVWSQRRVPLDTLLERFEGTPLSGGPQALVVEAPGASSTLVKDFFSPGSFTGLSESEALNRAAFERLPAGIAVGLATGAAPPLGRSLGVQQFVLPAIQATPAPSRPVPPLVLDGAAGQRAAVRDFARRAAAVRVRDEGWTLRGSDGALLAAGLSQTDAHQRARYRRVTALPENDLIKLGDI